MAFLTDNDEHQVRVCSEITFLRGLVNEYQNELKAAKETIVKLEKELAKFDEAGEEVTKEVTKKEAKNGHVEKRT